MSRRTPVVVAKPKPPVPVTVPNTARGIPGPKGDPGLVLVRHGNVASVPRPDTDGIVMWRGSVQPENWDTSQDLWLLEE